MSQSASEARTSHRRCRHCARQRPGSCRQGPDRPPASPPSPPPVSRSGSSNTRLAPCLVIRLRLDLARGPGLSDRCGACYGTRHVTRAALPKGQRSKLCSRRPAYRGRRTLSIARFGILPRTSHVLAYLLVWISGRTPTDTGTRTSNGTI